MSEPAQTPPRSKVADHVKRMTRMQKVLIGSAAGLVGIGVTAQVLISKSSTPTTSAANTTSVQAPAGSRGFVSGNPDSAAAEAPGDHSAPPPGWVQALPPGITKVGGAFLIGVILGIAARLFVKTVSLLVMAGLGIMLALSYFGVINMDMTSAKVEYQSTMAWVSDQMFRVGQTLIQNFGGSASTLAGLFVGFRRK